MNRKINLSTALMLVLAAVLAAFGISYLYVNSTLYKTAHESKLDQAMDVIDDYYVGDYSREDVEDEAVSAMVKALNDRWSYYIKADEMQSYLDTTNNQYSGVGISIEKTDEGITIAGVFADSPAEKAGLAAGDVILKIGGEDASTLDTDGVRELVQEGIDSGTVEFEVRGTDGEERSCSVTPGVVDINPVSYEMLDGNIGYVKIDNFESNEAEKMKNACNELIDQGAKGLVFDLRFNPGGLLTELLDSLDYLLPEGTMFISETKDSGLKKETSDASCVKLPMAVLVNSDSYSAAEFFAAALQEYHWADIIGEKTTGKGYAQITANLSDGSGIHISAKKYYTPNGVSLAGVGITPDKEVALTDDERSELYYGKLNKDEDAQLAAALETVKDKAEG